MFYYIEVHLLDHYTHMLEYVCGKVDAEAVKAFLPSAHMFLVSV
jgi:hypothetical protein